MQPNDDVTDNNAFFLTATYDDLYPEIFAKRSLHELSILLSRDDRTTHRGTHCSYLPEQGITDRVGTLVFAVRKYQF